MKKRDLSFDFIKSFSILSVIISHLYTFQVCSSYSSKCTHDLLYSFGMPLFAIVSGYFYSQKGSTVDFVKRKFLQILLPVFFWSFVAMLVLRVPVDIKTFSTDNFHILPYIRDNILCLLNSAWFLKALFLCFLYFYFAKNINKYVNLQIILSVIILYSLCLFDVIPNKNSYFEGFVFLYPFFCVGYHFKKFTFSNIKKLLLGSIVFFVMWCVLYSKWKHGFCFYTTNTSMFANPYPCPYSDVPEISGWLVPLIMMYRFIIGLTGSLAVLLFVKFMDNYIGNNKIYMVFSELGQYTLGCYLMQDIILPQLKDTCLSQLCNKYYIVAILFTFVLWILLSVFIKYTSRWGSLSFFMWGKR